MIITRDLLQGEMPTTLCSSLNKIPENVVASCLHTYTIVTVNVGDNDTVKYKNAK